MSTIWLSKHGNGGSSGHDDRENNDDPFQFSINLSKITSFDAFSIMPRQDDQTNGRFRHFEFYVAETQDELDSKIQNNDFLSSGDINYNSNLSTLVYFNTTIKAQFIVIRSLYHDGFGSCAEFNLYSFQITPTPTKSELPTPTKSKLPTQSPIQLQSNEITITDEVSQSDQITSVDITNSKGLSQSRSQSITKSDGIKSSGSNNSDNIQNKSKKKSKKDLIKTITLACIFTFEVIIVIIVIIFIVIVVRLKNNYQEIESLIENP